VADADVSGWLLLEVKMLLVELITALMLSAAEAFLDRPWGHSYR